MRAINKILVHCTDTPDGSPVSVNQVRDWHIKRGFSDIGYHYLIGIYGEIFHGRPEDQEGAHCEDNGGNHGSIAICLVGRLEYSVSQITSLTTLVLEIMANYGLTPTDVYCHYEFDDKGKTCPTFSANMLRALISASKKKDPVRGKKIGDLL